MFAIFWTVTEGLHTLVLSPIMPAPQHARKLIQCRLVPASVQFHGKALELRQTYTDIYVTKNILDVMVKHFASILCKIAGAHCLLETNEGGGLRGPMCS